MHRRNIFKAAAAAVGGVFATKAIVTSAAAQGAGAAKVSASKVAYHLSDADKVAFVLGNIQNHLDGGPKGVEIVLVVHGPALKGFHAMSADPAVSQKVENFSKAGVKFDACGNTLKAQKVELADLVPGFKVVEEGGVVRLAELQSLGYAYLRP
ncbi:MAG TPA: DsrE family protein [Beijerinckiaceae bacterium]|jgi:hypothetical protein|nr:DsrE family protein [Beijerinckiaceae bacterium]